MNQVLVGLVGGSFLMSKTFKISLNRLQRDGEILLAWRTVTGLMDCWVLIIWGPGAFSPHTSSQFAVPAFGQGPFKSRCSGSFHVCIPGTGGCCIPISTAREAASRGVAVP